MVSLPQKSGYLGALSIRSWDRNGNSYIYRTPNLITYSAAKMSAHALMGETAFRVKYLGVGTGTTAPSRSDTSLQTESHREEITAFSFPTVDGSEIGQVEFTVFLDFDSPANGSTLTEAGLIAENGSNLFARQVHVSVVKDSNFKLEYRWRIVFT